MEPYINPILSPFHSRYAHVRSAIDNYIASFITSVTQSKVPSVESISP